MDRIYLDHNATTPTHPEVAHVMAKCFDAGYANPASAHWAGRQARRILENAREAIAEILGADTSGARMDRMIFTSGGTEANNLALRGLAGSPPGKIVISPIEHPSVVDTCEFLRRQGFEIERLRVSRDGVVDVDSLRRLIVNPPRLVSVMLGNNETGVLQPVADLAAVCRDHGVAMHTDAVQVVGKLPVDFRQLGVTALTASAHKFHGPPAVGALLVRSDATLTPILFGGFHQQGARPGTESVALALGMHRALEIWRDEAENRLAKMMALRDRLEQRLITGQPDLVINGRGAPRLPHTTNVSFPGLDRQSLLMALDRKGVACSTGSACASGSSEPSPVLLAMGCSKSIVASSLRISLGATTTRRQIDQAAGYIINAVNELRRQKRIRKSTLPSR